MTSIIDEIIAEVTEKYIAMSLLELLSEENQMIKLSYDARLDNVRKKLLPILRSEIERKLQ